jgi:HPt (histidine-containing phosphotransfer) domain-containing protein
MKEKVLSFPLLDENRVLHFVQKGDTEFIEDILSLFDSRSMELLQRITSYELPVHQNELRKDIHTLKGIGFTMGTKRLAEVCQLIEQLTEDGSAHEALELRPVLDETLKESLRELRSKLQA